MKKVKEGKISQPFNALTHHKYICITTVYIYNVHVCIIYFLALCKTFIQIDMEIQFLFKTKYILSAMQCYFGKPI